MSEGTKRAPIVWIIENKLTGEIETLVKTVSAQRAINHHVEGVLIARPATHDDMHRAGKIGIEIEEEGAKPPPVAPVMTIAQPTQSALQQAVPSIPSLREMSVGEAAEV